MENSGCSGPVVSKIPDQSVGFAGKLAIEDVINDRRNLKRIKHRMLTEKLDDRGPELVFLKRLPSRHDNCSCLDG